MKILKLPLREKKFFKGEASLNIYKLIIVTIYKKFNKGEIFIMSKLKSALQGKEAKGEGLTVSKSYAMKQLMIKMNRITIIKTSICFNRGDRLLDSL